MISKDEVNEQSKSAVRQWWPLWTENAKINGERVQIGNTSEMFFDVPALMVYLSELTTLQPGDVILTGSPKLIRGEPQPAVSLKPGDEVEVSIEGLGSVVNTVISEGQAQS